jgi:hypothetical protein
MSLLKGKKDWGFCGGEHKPTVALPPNLINPHRRKGTERVVIPGTTSRMTITSSGFFGTSFVDIVAESIDVAQNVNVMFQMRLF